MTRDRRRLAMQGGACAGAPHPARTARLSRIAWLCAVLAVLGACAAGGGAPPIRTGTACHACSMPIGDLRFACERRVDGAWRAYDSIECLLRDAAAPVSNTPRTVSYLADYDTRGLHAADSLWVVRGSFPSPMGGGYAAFIDRAAADSIAARTTGRVDRLAGFERKEGSW